MVPQLHHLKISDYEKQLWKNGGGESRQIAVDTQSPFRWRLSWSQVKASGPFSDYTNYDRVLTVLGPSSIEVEITDGKSRKRTLSPLSPFQFRGEAKVNAEVRTAVEDLNLFCLREKSKGAMYSAFLAESEEYRFPYRGQHHFVFVVEGSVEIQEPNLGKQFILAKHETCWLSRPAQEPLLDIRAVGKGPERSSVLWIVVHVS